MDSAQLAAFAAALSALPTSAFLIIVIIILWRRLLAVTDLLIDAKPMKTDDSTKLVSPAAAAAPAAPAGPEVIRALPAEWPATLPAGWPATLPDN